MIVGTLFNKPVHKSFCTKRFLIELPCTVISWVEWEKRSNFLKTRLCVCNTCFIRVRVCSVFRNAFVSHTYPAHTQAHAYTAYNTYIYIYCFTSGRLNTATDRFNIIIYHFSIVCLALGVRTIINIFSTIILRSLCTLK